MNLYRVKVETEVVVVAEDEQGAEEAARDALATDVDPEFDVAPLRFLPIGWNGGEIPWPDPYNNNIPERTVNEWIDAGAAPELTKRMAEWRSPQATNVASKKEE